MLTEMTPSSETVTAVITSHTSDGTNYDGAIIVGYYPDNREEIFVQHEGTTLNVQCDDVDAFCKQLKRAKKLAQEQEVTE